MGFAGSVYQVNANTATAALNNAGTAKALIMV
jgi:hypothetical protein